MADIRMPVASTGAFRRRPLTSIPPVPNGYRVYRCFPLYEMTGVIESIKRCHLLTLARNYECAMILQCYKALKDSFCGGAFTVHQPKSISMATVSLVYLQ